MTPEVERDLTTEDLAAYLEGEVTHSEASRMERQLQESVGARRRLASLLSIRDALVQPVPELKGLDLVPSVRRAMTQPTPLPSGGRRWRWETTMPWAVAAASVSVVIGLGVHHRATEAGGFGSAIAKFEPIATTVAVEASDDEFRAKSGVAQADPARWSGLQVYRVQKGGRPERVTKSFARGDGLLFSYTNLGRTPSEYLMIFAVDARGEVRWFHPAYEREGENPESIPIRKGEADVPLPDLIHHDFGAGRLELHAVFSSRPLNVLEIEAAVAGKQPGERLALPNVVDQVFKLRVEP